MDGFGDYNALFLCSGKVQHSQLQKLVNASPSLPPFKGYKSNSIFMLFYSSFLVLIMPIRAVVLVMLPSVF